MLTKKEYIAQQRAREEEARKDGYSDREIAEAYEVAAIMGVKYIDSYSLNRGRERLLKDIKQNA